MKGVLDSHFHTLSMINKGVDVIALFDRLFEEGFEGGVDIAVDPDDLELRTPITDRYPKIRLSAGVGPWGLEEGKPSIDEQIQIIRKSIEKHSVDFIGEIGLDNHYSTYGTREQQEELFIKQIELANALDLPIIVHSREAAAQTAEVLRANKVKRGGILHCFSGTTFLSNAALQEGFYVSFAGPITYKNAENLRSVLKTIPHDRLLLETDSPYLTPQVLRGTVNTPENMKHIYRYAAECLDLPLEKLKEIVLENFNRLLSK